ncbi:serine/threonine protein kinase [Candidatus Sumerlaeota bacterium]|nr:serine/threonine protein kinase [Candidatus Sumerlaeota bacterium]
MKTPPGYEILEQLGDGGQGEVFKARQIHLDRMVALKTARPTASGKTLSQNLERLLREARTIAKFDHPNIVRVFDCFVFEDQIYIVMEFLDGHPLSHILDERILGKLPPLHREMMESAGHLREEWTVLIATLIARALEYAHGHRIYHRDIKPSNIFVTRTGDVKLFDFSIARDEQFKGLTAEGVVIGSPPYMCPEQVKGEVSDARSDLYSLGCVLYHCVTGHVPFDEPSEIMTCIAHMEKAPRSPALMRQDVSQRLSEIILQCMEKQKEARFQSALSLEEALMTDFGDRVDALASRIYPRTSSNRVSRIVVERPLEPPPEPPRKKSGATGFVLVSAAAIIAAIAFAVLGNKSGNNVGTVTSNLPAVATPTPVPLTEEQRAAAATEARVANASMKLAKWEADARKDGSLVSSGVVPGKLSWVASAEQPITLETANANTFPVEVNYYFGSASMTYEGIDVRDTWRPVRGTLDIGGYGFGSAFGAEAILLQPRETGQLALVPSDVFQLPAAMYVRVVRLGDFHFLASTAAETAAEIAQEGDMRTESAFALPALPEERTELPKSLGLDPILKKSLEDAFSDADQKIGTLNDKLMYLSQEESTGNFLKFLQRAQSAGDTGRILDPSLVQVREVRVDAITGAIDLMLEVDSSGKDVEITAFVARGDQRLTLLDGEKNQEASRPLRGLLTPVQKFRIADFRDRKRLPLVDLFRNNAGLGALSFQANNEIRIDRLLVLCAYTREDSPQNAKPQPLNYKVISGLRTSR